MSSRIPMPNEEPEALRSGESRPGAAQDAAPLKGSAQNSAAQNSTASDERLDERFRSASGLRPASAFVLIGFVLALVAARAAVIALHEQGEQPHNLQHLPILPVTFDLVDAQGVPMATSIEYLQLVMSPNAMWQAHTPDQMAAKLASALGEPANADALLASMLPDAKNGIITCTKEFLVLDEAKKQRVAAWLTAGTLDPKAKNAAWIQGVGFTPGEQPGSYYLQWKPRVVLSDAERKRHNFDKPLDWSRRFADDLGICILGDAAPALTDTDEERQKLRSRVWSALMPTQFKSLLKEVPVAHAQAIYDLLKEERVQAHQMEIRRNAKRVYPVKGSGQDTPPVAVLGRWGTLDPDDARAAAIEELGLTADDSTWSLQQQFDVRDVSVKKIYQPSPMSGVELLSNNMLEAPDFDHWLKRRGEEYTFLANQVPRQPLHRYFQELVPGDDAPRVVTTIEIGLQRVMRAALERTMEDNKPALAMAICLDVATGSVLAVDAIDPYEMGGFLPTMHTFTPGSTMKAVIMASALQEGVVRPGEMIDAHHGHFVFQGRPIREAEGAKDKDMVTAAEGLAYSINAVLVQIGTRMSAEVLRRHLIDLGYSQYPESGLGNERCGTVRKLPWVTKYTHASVCFGHEMFVTLWQHAAALCTLVRGGHYRPLRLVAAVEQDGVRKEIPLVENNPLQQHDSISPEACAGLREMMMLGASVGTGRKVYHPEIVMGTKTGTAQKVPGEVCLHVELQHNREHGCHGARECRVLLAKEHVHSGPCYTSSMCIWGHRPEGGREVMVLVVVDEPRGPRHFGSEVAGPAAIAIVREALGFTSAGQEIESIGAGGFRAVTHEPEDASDQPWGEIHARR
jgi:hypothetical protein